MNNMIDNLMIEQIRIIIGRCNYEFCLNNTHRKYMGLKLLKPNYDLKIIKKGDYDEYYLFFNDSKIVKVIHYNISDKNIEMTEEDVNYDTIQNRSIVLPKTFRGKIEN